MDSATEPGPRSSVNSPTSTNRRPTHEQQRQGQTFQIEDITDLAERDRAFAEASRACAGCPIVENCLKWALANPDLTETGVWAATTHRTRRRIRRNLTARLGPDWVEVVARRGRPQLQRRLCNAS